MTFKLILPKRSGANGIEEIEVDNNSVVIIGANGSGKSRLGAWIDTYPEQASKTHRISALRLIQLNKEELILKAPELLRSSLRYGQGSGTPIQKLEQRWRRQPTTRFIDDFALVLSLLYSEDANISRKYRKSTDSVVSPTTSLDIIEGIWSELFPSRKMMFDFDKLEPIVKMDNNIAYPGKEMSDGERVAIYFMAQCLSADDGDILIVDEPETHLHKSILTKLWDKLERACDKNLFVYITHDIDFATSRRNAAKIWVQSFATSEMIDKDMKLSNIPAYIYGYNTIQSWCWYLVEPNLELPEDLILQIMGTRQPILFVEAKKGDWDSAIYDALFPDRLIIPVEGSREVKKAVKSVKMLMQNLPLMNQVEPIGLIDRDYNSEHAIQELRQADVYCLEVAEVENLFCVQGVIEAIARKQILDPVEMSNEFKTKAFKMLEGHIELQATRKTTQDLEGQVLDRFNGKSKTKADLAASISRLKDVPTMMESIYTQNDTLFRNVVKQQDFDGLLKHYNNKGLPDTLARMLGLSDKDKYMGWVIRILNSQDDAETKTAIREAIKPYLPVELHWE